MQFALLMNAVASPNGPGFPAAYSAFLARLRSEGTLRGARRLASPRETTTVRTREGSARTDEGPAQAGKAQLAAFVLVESSSENEAVDLAAELSVTTATAVEVRLVAEPGEGGSDKTGVAESRPSPGRSEYAFIINVAEDKRPWPGNPAFDDLMERCGKVLEKLEAHGAFRGTVRLAPASTAKTVTAQAGGRRVLDGPFAEARELIGGFILGECKNREEAITLAGLIPGSVSGSVEVREVLAEE